MTVCTVIPFIFDAVAVGGSPAFPALRLEDDAAIAGYPGVTDLTLLVDKGDRLSFGETQPFLPADPLFVPKASGDEIGTAKMTIAISGEVIPSSLARPGETLAAGLECLLQDVPFFLGGGDIIEIGASGLGQQTLNTKRFSQQVAA